ncbi:MAG: glycosyltransferase [Candidatus Omnitrophota bacterium]
MNVTILIPSYNPDHRLHHVVNGLIELNVNHIIIIDDGSHSDCQPIFERLEELPQCHVLRHAVNCGKGRALKTGLNYFYLHLPESDWIVTADGDGQHKPDDILKVARSLKEHQTPDKLIIGSRQWSSEVPFRSLFGNVLTKIIFSALVGMKLSDTQSGLRGIHRSFIPKILTLKGERYEYEMNMLIATREHTVKILETPIDTVYIENNKTSHFNPLIDSMKIYFLLFRFLFSSLFSAFIDFITFISIFSMTGSILMGITVSRCVSGIVNFSVNKNIVFKDRSRLFPTVCKFGLLLLIRGVISYMLIKQVIHFFDFRAMGAYLLVESSLFFASFTIQRDFVFGSNERE